MVTKLTLLLRFSLLLVVMIFLFFQEKVMKFFRFLILKGGFLIFRFSSGIKFPC